MPVFQLDERLLFPPPDVGESDGLLAVGGDLRPGRLLLAYSQGIFPWPHDDMPLMWFSPDPRMVLMPDELRLSRSLRGRLRRGTFRVTADTAFRAVLEGCAGVDRPDQDGTWITSELIDAYCRLHELGLAHSVEAWHDGQLAGGLYGVSLGAAFFGESMFTRVTDASKVAFATLVRWLGEQGFHFIDCQLHTRHLERFGAREWRRADYVRALGLALEQPTRKGRWSLDGAPVAVASEPRASAAPPSTDRRALEGETSAAV